MMRTVIEDYLPIYAIGGEAAKEKSLWRHHPFTLHPWWARRPLVACRAAVYSSMVPADRWVEDIELKQPPADPTKTEAIKNGKKRGLNRQKTKQFIEALCKYPGDSRLIRQAREHILEAHAQRLTAELSEMCESEKIAWVKEFRFGGGHVKAQDIIEGRAPRPRILDMFAGGGAIPLEALRLGCEAFALDLNPVAHIIELCTLYYPQSYGKPDDEIPGTTGPKNLSGDNSWGGLPDEVRHWGKWVRDRIATQISDCYPGIPDPVHGTSRLSVSQQKTFWHPSNKSYPAGTLKPIGYLWTRTVRCKNPSCTVTVPLVRQTWLCKKKDRYVALKMITPKNAKAVRFEVVETKIENGFDFDPSSFSSAGNANCPFCGTVADIGYVKEEGWKGAIGQQLMAVVCVREGHSGKVYLSADDVIDYIGSPSNIQERIDEFTTKFGLTPPNEPIAGLPSNSRDNTLGITVRPYGLRTWGDLFTPRQILCMLTLASTVKDAYTEMLSTGMKEDMARAVATYLGMAVDREAENCSSLCRWNPNSEKLQGTFGRQALPMVWDFCEINPLGGSVGDWESLIDLQVNAIVGAMAFDTAPGRIERGSAMALPWQNGMFDAVITDPPYYDNVPYADISDFFFVWLKRTIGHLYPDHFATEGTPKKQEAIADSGRHNGDKQRADEAYESMMARAFGEAWRVLKANGQMVVVYAHKTTLGWTTLVDALRGAGFVVTEAWPLDTEMRTRLRGMESAALASSIFLVARKRDVGAGIGQYEDNVQPELLRIVRERVDTLWDMGITGADLVIAAVGAGLRAFTKYERVEYANGEQVPAEKFLAEVEGVVLETMMAKLFGITGGNVSAVDPASRFYVLWRFVYKTAEIDAGEAIVFTYSQHVELDGPKGLSIGKDALVEKKKAKYRISDFTERGQHDKLGLPPDDGQPAPLIDVLHRILWLIENRPRKLAEFLDEARPDRERLRVVAQTLAGAALSGKSEQETERLVSTTPAEQTALGKLLANWRNLIESQLVGIEEGLFGKMGR
jgi:putative DNA methylase